MAVGDVVNNITSSVASGASVDYQPASGVEVMITRVFSNQWTGTAPNGTPDLDVGLYDGSTHSLTTLGGQGLTNGNLKIFINNTFYLRLKNTNGGSGGIGYCGVQTK